MPNINIRISQEQKDLIEAKALSLGFDSVGAFMKFAATSVKVKVDATMPSQNKHKPTKPSKTSNELDEAKETVTDDPTPIETDVETNVFSSDDNAATTNLDDY